MRLFIKRCSRCHTAIAEQGHDKGPNLARIFGRDAGTVEGFDFSGAMKDSGITWTKTTLLQFMKNPREVVFG